MNLGLVVSMVISDVEITPPQGAYHRNAILTLTVIRHLSKMESKRGGITS